MVACGYCLRSTRLVQRVTDMSGKHYKQHGGTTWFEKRKNENLLIHVAAVILGSITGKGDDMVCSRQDWFNRSQREGAAYEPPKDRRENPASQ